jgi:hypothetical protein
MRFELASKLVEDFPLLYGGYINFDCGDGWEPIIRELSQKITKILQKMPEEDLELRKVLQIKEKYGSLRVYVSITNDEIEDTIRDSCQKSIETCEICGRPGKMKTKGSFMFVRCEDCQ